MESLTSLNFDNCYRAVSARDARFDGLFFTAVRTTGIYCRSVCSARTPKPSSCTFFETAAAAERAGYRPCLRCRPELAPGRPDYAAGLAEAVLARVQAGALDSASVETLAARIGLSSRQVRRILVDHFGVTPIEVAQTQRLLFAKKLLHETGLPMTEIALAAGFGSLRRFNDVFKTRYGLSPSALKRAAGPATAASNEVTIRLSYRPPLAWDALLGYFERRATRGVESVDRQGYWRTLQIELDSGVLSGWLNVRPIAETSQLAVTVPAHLAPALMPISLRLRAQFDLDCDPARVANHLGDDALLAPIVRAAPGLRVAGAWDGFELALRAVLGQQVSVAGASTLAGRLAQRFGQPVDCAHPHLTHLAATPAALAGANEAQIAAIGLPGARARTIKALAQFALAGGFSASNGSHIDRRVLELMALPGIGAWTAQYIAMRALRHPDAFPAGDLGLRKAARAPNEAALPTVRALERRAEHWRPWRAYAAAYLWHSLTLGTGERQ
jgi:AraC family transcriptional regulator of adaptative response / DNA-3-methyladenine glycosylase II